MVILEKRKISLLLGIKPLVVQPVAHLMYCLPVLTRATETITGNISRIVRVWQKYEERNFGINVT